MKVSTAIANWIDTAIPNFRAGTVAQTPAFNSRAGIAHVRLPEALIRYRVVGTGTQTIVLATDPPIVIEHYDELIAHLAADFRLIIFELPGFGFSMPRSGFSFDFLRVNDLVAEFLRRIEMGPYLLAFPCASAYCAIDIAARYQELVRGVVLIQAPSWSEEVKWKHGRDKRGLLSTPVIGQLALQILKRKRAPKWLAAAVGRREKLSLFAETSDTAFSHGACFCLASAFQRYLTDVSPVLTAIAQPALVIWGEADQSHCHTDKSSTKLYCPNSKDVRFEAAGHFPELEEPEIFAEEVREWARTLNA
jgi:pimeloyl-ACP methyl ester carboxylesterase